MPVQSRLPAQSVQQSIITDPLLQSLIICRLRQVHEFLFRTITCNSLIFMNITFDLKYHYNITKLHYIIY